MANSQEESDHESQRSDDPRRQTVQPDQTAREAASFMLSADAGSIPVTEGDRLIGMITDRDIAVRGVAKGHGPDTPVRDLMTDDIVCARDRRRCRRRRDAR